MADDFGISTKNIISKKKPAYPLNDNFKQYLEQYERIFPIHIEYQDLLRFTDSTPVIDKNGRDTLWISVIYPQWEFDEFNQALKRVYMLLYSDGNKEAEQHLQVVQIDFCTFGNSKPFRIKVKNVLNDNHDYFYVKEADASRVYGIELENMLSPNTLNFIVYKNTLIEEHISGIPGDVFINHDLVNNIDNQNLIRLSKEFVKFNERCFIRLLGDMRSYNYVVVLTPDFDDLQYRIRPIDFDQQCYEGRLQMYKPQFFKENKKLVDLVLENLSEGSIHQYQNEERSVLAKRLIANRHRLTYLLEIMKKDTLSSNKKMVELKTYLLEEIKDVSFKNAESMGEIVYSALSFVLRNYESNIHKL